MRVAVKMLDFRSLDTGSDYFDDVFWLLYEAWLCITSVAVSGEGRGRKFRSLVGMSLMMHKAILDTHLSKGGDRDGIESIPEKKKFRERGTSIIIIIINK